MNIRVAGTGPTAVIDPKKAKLAMGDGSAARTGERTVYFGPEEGSPSCALYDRDKLVSGDTVVGAAIIEQYDSTIVVPPWADASVDGYRNIIIERR